LRRSDRVQSSRRKIVITTTGHPTLANARETITKPGLAGAPPGEVPLQTFLSVLNQPLQGNASRRLDLELLELGTVDAESHCQLAHGGQKLNRTSAHEGVISATRAGFFKKWLRALRLPPLLQHVGLQHVGLHWSISPKTSRLFRNPEFRHPRWHGARATTRPLRNIKDRLDRYTGLAAACAPLQVLRLPIQAA
jgi:hypothetical protein